MRYYRGYLRVALTGFSPERFLNLCMANQIIIWNLRYREQGYEFCITLSDYRRIRPLARKAGVHLKLKGRYGLPFFLHRNRYRKWYAVGVACFFLILFVMSRFIWNISLEGNYRFTDDMLLHYLDTRQVRYGSPKHQIDCDLLEESIRSQYPEILWVSARISGTRLLIKVKENEVIGAMPTKEDAPRDLVAEKGGTITEILVRQGRCMVKKGDVVEAGSLLVSGRIPILNDAEEEVGCRYVRADADIRLRTSQSFRESIPRLVTEKAYTKQVRHGIRLRMFHYDLICLLPGSAETQWEITEESHQAVLLGDFYLPVWWSRITAREYGTYQRIRRPDELDALKEQINNAKIQNLMQKGVQIIENNVKILDKSTHWVVQGDFILEEPVGVGQNIKQEEEQEQPDERNGNHN
ncbi:MAG: sporulation protein YqfD [Lachnospiraceae bacterium]|nr:sporulation protein YqfD [Lachnospiraceae bacterium]